MWPPRTSSTLNFWLWNGSDGSHECMHEIKICCTPYVAFLGGSKAEILWVKIHQSPQNQSSCLWESLGWDFLDLLWPGWRPLSTSPTCFWHTWWVQDAYLDAFNLPGHSISILFCEKISSFYFDHMLYFRCMNDQNGAKTNSNLLKASNERIDLCRSHKHFLSTYNVFHMRV